MTRPAVRPSTVTPVGCSGRKRCYELGEDKSSSDAHDGGTQAIVTPGQLSEAFGVVIKTGMGGVMKAGCVYTIQHNASDRRVLIKSDAVVKSGSASLQSPPGALRCTIMDKNTANNSCVCL